MRVNPVEGGRQAAAAEAPIARAPFAPALFAAVIAALGWTSLAIEFHRSMAASAQLGRGLWVSLFDFFRFFTNLTNIAIAMLMSVTVVHAIRRIEPPRCGFYNAALAYGIVTCVTYETILRSSWKPEGVQFFTDLVVHDIVPALLFTFWALCAPRAGARWSDALWLLVYPTVYFTITLTAGALGCSYPYNFFNVDKLGYPSVILIGCLFLMVFYTLGLITTGLSRALAREKRTET